MKKTVIGISILIAAIILYWLARPEKPTAITLITVEKGTVEETVANTRAGTVKACQRSRLSPSIGGRVAELLVHNGDRVSRDQPLLILWNQDQQARKQQADALITSTVLRKEQTCHAAARDQREADRQSQLAAKHLISDETLDMARTQAKTSKLACLAAKSAVEEARANAKLQEALLSQTILRAPFDGIVAEINGEIGEYVTPSPPGVATPPAIDLIDDRCLYVRAPIDEVDVADIRLDMPVRITLDAFDDRVFNGRVSRIAPYVQDYEKQARTIDVEVKFDKLPEDVKLLAGYSADIEIILKSKSGVLRVPTEAIIEGNKVWRYIETDHRLEQVSFQPGLSNWSYTEVVSGLTQQDRILRSLDVEDLSSDLPVVPADD